ncbi:hypothetical protein JAO29_06890 [Edaphobacter sp. HDX4]|uniref:hypothetical protein n=1 Tax=Edaphobacter sp. HDX4 TaxID=2794064 RepID=UPI002FE5E580
MNARTRTGTREEERTFSLWTAFFVAASSLLWLSRIYTRTRSRLWFDDAFMFYRYAENLHNGFGMSWNAAGQHTFGETSLVWGAAVWLLTFFPGNPGFKLQLLSSICSGLALVAIAWTVSSLARSSYLRHWMNVLPLVALPLLVAPVFLDNLATGMETMLAMAMVAAYVGALLHWLQGRRSSLLCGIVGILLLLTRPEAGIVVVLFPCAAFLLLKTQRTVRDLTWFFGRFVVGIVVIGVLTRFYFGTALPLSFYIKGRHFYEGYKRSWTPATSFVQFLAASGLYLATIVLCVRRETSALISAFTLPLLAVSFYLLTVLQIMGFSARYYLPYLPLIVIPSLLTLDLALIPKPREMSESEERPILRFAGLAIVLYLVAQNYPSSLLYHLDRTFEGRRFAYEEADRVTRAKRPLPEISWRESIFIFGDGLVRGLPAGATLASSEVGYIGAIAPQVQLIDLSGLNDTNIALHGFRVEDLIRRRPDLIWLPHSDYTFQRGQMFAEPDFLNKYIVFDDALLYGVAIRKDSPYRVVIEAKWKPLWQTVYPGYPMDDYIVQSSRWSRTEHEVF